MRAGGRGELGEAGVGSSQPCLMSALSLPTTGRSTNAPCATRSSRTSPSSPHTSTSTCCPSASASLSVRLVLCSLLKKGPCWNISRYKGGVRALDQPTWTRAPQPSVGEGAGKGRPAPTAALPLVCLLQNTHQSGRVGEETAGKGTGGAPLTPKTEPEELAVSQGGAAAATATAATEESSSSSEEEEPPSSPEPPAPALDAFAP